MTRKMKLTSWVVVLGVGLLAAQVGAQEAQVLKTQKDQMSYSLGADMGRNLKRNGIEVDLDLMIRGLKDGLSSEKLLISERDLRRILSDFQAELRRKRVEAMKTAAEDNKKEGDSFLAENKTKEGVVTLPSGLQYKILKAGDGRKPTEADMVEVNYRGTLLDGTVFDSTYENKKPALLKVNGVIRGWSEALQLMPVGSKWQIFVPPQLAYAARGSGLIGPNATIIFDVELLAIK
jgi:FKBP-type peptidyl-prolyl cis-trans isomerase FklB